MTRLLSILLIGLLLFSHATPSFSAGLKEPVAVVVSTKGDVTVERKEGSTKASEGMMLSKGDIIRTGAGSSAEIAFDEAWQNVTKLDEKTELTVEALDNVRLNMTLGSLLANLDALEKNQTFEVRTPTCAAVVRGTIFDVSTEGGVSDLRGFDGVVSVFGIDKKGKLFGEGRIQAGERMGIQRFRRPGKIQRLSKDAWKKGRNRAKTVRTHCREARRRCGLQVYRRGTRKGPLKRASAGKFREKALLQNRRVRNSNVRAGRSRSQRNLKKKSRRVPVKR